MCVSCGLYRWHSQTGATRGAASSPSRTSVCVKPRLECGRLCRTHCTATAAGGGVTGQRVAGSRRGPGCQPQGLSKQRSSQGGATRPPGQLGHSQSQRPVWLWRRGTGFPHRGPCSKYRGLPVSTGQRQWQRQTWLQELWGRGQMCGMFAVPWGQMQKAPEANACQPSRGPCRGPNPGSGWGRHWASDVHVLWGLALRVPQTF